MLGFGWNITISRVYPNGKTGRSTDARGHDFGKVVSKKWVFVFGGIGVKKNPGPFIGSGAQFKQKRPGKGAGGAFFCVGCIRAGKGGLRAGGGPF